MNGPTADALQRYVVALRALVERLEAVVHTRQRPSGAVSARQRPSNLVRHNGSRDTGPMLLLSFDDVAAWTGRSRSTVERMARDGELPVVMFGGRPAVRPADLVGLVDGLPVHNGKHEDSHAGDGGTLAPLRPAAAGGVEQRAGLAGGSGSAHPAGPAHKEGEAA